MAHRTNVIQVMNRFETTQDPKKTSVDPVCKMEVARASAKHILYRHDKTYYFCSKECQNKFTQFSFSPTRQIA
jgi:YHS domain-containing protein